MSEYTEADLEAITYTEEVGKSAGRFFFPEQQQREAYDIALSLAKSALGFIGTKHDEGVANRFEQPRRSEYEHLADTSIKVASLLFQRIPARGIVRFERTNRALDNVPSQQNPESVKEYIRTRLLNIFIENPDKGLSYLDISGLLFPNDTSPHLYTRTVNAIYAHRSYIEQELAAYGRTLSMTKVIRAHHSRPRRVVAYINRSIEQVSEDAMNLQIEHTWKLQEQDRDTAASVQRRSAGFAMTRWYRNEREATTVSRYEWRAEVREMAADLRSRDDIEWRETQRKKREELGAETIEAKLIIPRFLEATKILDTLDTLDETYPQESQISEEKLADTNEQEYQDRKTQILEMLASDYSDKDIAEELHISVDTLKWHIRGMLEIMGAKNRYQAVYLGLNDGLISLPKATLLSLRKKSEGWNHLTARRKQILELVMEDNEAEEIATTLGISAETVISLKKKAYIDLGINGRLELSLMKFAAQAEIDDTEPKLHANGKKFRTRSNQSIPATDKPKGTPPVAPIQKNGSVDLLKIERGIKPEEYMSTLGIWAGRKIVKLLVPEDLINYDNVKTEIDNMTLLSFLKRLGAISDEQFESKEVGLKGLIAALILDTPMGKQLLTSQGGKKNLKKITEVASAELQAQIVRVNAAKKSSKA